MNSLTRPTTVVWTFALAGLLSAAFPVHASGADAPRPNIVIILLDDLGYSDFGCYGGEIRTPNIDSLAAGGLRFTQFYNAARCCPTRASLLTGLYAHQVGLANNGESLTRDGVTIAEVLRESGYRTAMTGKWHLTKTPVLPQKHLQWVNHQLDPGRPFGPLETYPVRRGFERHYGIIWGVVDYFDPFSLVDGTEPVDTVPDDYYITDAITAKSVEAIRDFAAGEVPFFLYVAHCAPHWPLHARPEDIAHYRDTYRGGWHELREQRYRRQVEMGLIDPATHPLPPLHGTGPDWSQLSPEERDWEAENMAVHAAMVDRVDQGVGDIIAALKEAGEFDNTLILVLADNGASPERYRQPGYDRPSETRDGRPIQYEGFPTPGPETSWTYIGSWWANAANTPFRYWKKESYEGGCHSPLIAHWPAGLESRGGTHDELGHVIDVLPTCLEVAGATYPEQFAGHRIAPLEGKSLVPILRGEQRDGHQTLFFEHAGGRAVRTRDWKLVALPGQPWELYHISVDRTELHNVAQRHPDRVENMAREWHQWAGRVGADTR